MKTIMYKKTYDNINQSYSSTASFEGFAGSTADLTSLAEMMLYISLPINLDDVVEPMIKGHDLDFTLEKIMKKFDPALKKLSEL